MTTHRERPVDLPRFSVYAIELQDTRALGGPAQVYVGSTAKSPEERFARHLGGGPMANAKQKTVREPLMRMEEFISGARYHSPETI